MDKMKTILFLHGQGVREAMQADASLTLIRQALPAHTCNTLHYGDIVEALWYRIMTYEAPQADSSDIEADIDLAYLEGVWNTELGIQEEEIFAPSGTSPGNVLKITRDTWLYSARYLLRSTIRSAILDELIDQIFKIIREQRLDHDSILLLGHSLGSVVALDLLQNPNVQSYFARFVSVGSPLSAIASVPGIQAKLLPKHLRECPVHWTDIAAENDLVVSPQLLIFGPLPRLSERPDFSGAGESVTGITLPPIEGNAHSNYFYLEDVLQQWISHLR
jgi:hypothetical protein